MKIAVPTKDWVAVSGHAGQARRWLVYDLTDQGVAGPLPAPTRVELANEQLFHHFRDDGPHPLDGVEIVLAGSAGDGFVRHMKQRGADVLLTGETDPALALAISSPTRPCPISASTSPPVFANCATCFRAIDAAAIRLLMRDVRVRAAQTPRRILPPSTVRRRGPPV